MVLLAAALVGSIVSLRHRRVDSRVALAGLPVGAIVLAFASLPFIANRRIGELGASQLDDLSFHMGQADAIREVGPAASVTASGYPIGPHSLVAIVAEGTGLGTAPVFAGLLLAIPVLTALTALAAFRGVPPACASSVPCWSAFPICPSPTSRKAGSRSPCSRCACSGSRSS